MPAKVLRISENISPQEALQQFLLLKRAQGLSETTIEDYDYHATALFKHCSSDTWESLTAELHEYMSQEVKPNTYNLRLRNLRVFFAWCVGEGYLTRNPLQGWKIRKPESRVVNIPEEVLKLLLDTPDQKTFVGLRDYTLMLLQLDTGIRPKEAMSLMTEDVCFKQMLVSVRATSAKTRVARSLPISPQTAQAMKKLITAHHETWRTKLIFCTHEGQAMDRHSWAKRLAYYSNKIGYKVRPYDLRHTFALMYLRSGGNIFSLQRMMGHSNLTMTQKYLALTDEDLRNQHTQNSPLNSLTKARRAGNISLQ